MSGTYTSPDGKRGQRIQAAHEWLVRAEKQFSDGQDVMAAATLMLAQAEMKLIVEGVATDVVKTKPAPIARVKRPRIAGRTIFAIASLAACFLIGIMLGRVTVPPVQVEPVGTSSPVIRIAEAEPSPVAPLDIGPALIEEGTVGEPVSPEKDIVEDEIPVVETPSPAPAWRPARRPSPSPEPAVIPVTEEPELVVVEPPSKPADVDSVSSESRISSAEVALRTIQALSERLLQEATD